MKKKIKIFLLIAGAIAAIILVVIATVWIVWGKDKLSSFLDSLFRLTGIKQEQSVNPNLVTCKLCGKLVDKKDANHYPVAVMIDNHVQARPHIGLNDACIIYETLVEGGITRLMAVYGHGGVKQVGPVRSARTYYLDWASEYNALYAHAGGSPEALQLIRTYGILDMNHYIGQAYWRDLSAKTYFAPHNLFVNIDQLRADGLKKYSLADKIIQKFHFKNDSGLNNSRAGSIVINYSNYTPCSVKFIYDADTDTYVRYLGGKIDKDGLSKHSVRVKNLIIQITPAWLSERRSSRLAMQTTGSGKALVFQNGRVVSATWRKATRLDQTRFYNSNNKEIRMNRGLTWISIVRNQTLVKY